MRKVATTMARDLMASEESEPGDLAADPDALLDRLQESGWERNVLATLLETDDDAKEVMRGALPSINGFELHLSVGALMRWVERQRPGLARQRKAMAQRAGQPRLVRDDPPKDPGEVFEALLAENIELARTTYRSKYKQALQREGAVPAEVEELDAALGSRTGKADQGGSVAGRGDRRQHG